PPSLARFVDGSAPGSFCLSLHDALPICGRHDQGLLRLPTIGTGLRPEVDRPDRTDRYLEHTQLLVQGVLEPPLGLVTDLDPFARSEEHTSELQSRFDLVCRLLREKKNNR